MRIKTLFRHIKVGYDFVRLEIVADKVKKMELLSTLR